MLPTIFPLIVNLILEQNGKVLFIYRENTNTYNHLYALPAGKVEKGESLKQSIIREAKEEVGIDLHEDDLELVTTLWARYIYEDKNIEDVGFFFKSTSFKGDLVNAEPHKHGHLKWIALDDLPENLVPQTRTALQAYQNNLSYAEYDY